MTPDNSEQIRKVLSGLYTGVVDLMNLLAPDMVNDEMKARYLLHLLDNWKSLLPTDGMPVQGITHIPTVPVGERTCQPTVTSNATVGSSQVSSEATNKEVVEVRFVFNPTNEEDGKYYFKRSKKRDGAMNQNQEDDKSPLANYYYKIIVYSDNTFEFTTNDEWLLDSDDLTVLRDSIDTIYPQAVAKYTGGITTSSKLRTIKPGKGHKEGLKNFIIDQPLEMSIE